MRMREARSMIRRMPRDVKEKPTLETFKAALDRHIQKIPDLPPISGYPFLKGEFTLGVGEERTLLNTDRRRCRGDEWSW